MTRASDGWENPAAYLWDSYLRRAIGSKRGQAALRELESALLALPKQRLIDDRLGDETGGVCALGALYVQRRPGFRDRVELLHHWEADIADSAHFGVDELGLAWSLAWTIAEENDSGGPEETPEARYTRMLAWVRRQIQPVAAAS